MKSKIWLQITIIIIRISRERMLELYLKDPADLKLMKGVKGLSVSAKLYELSMLVKN